MTCNNCGHTGTFVLLVQFALAVPGDTPSDAAGADGIRSADPNPADCSLAVQCPACDSTDVGVAAADLLARHGSSTTS